MEPDEAQRTVTEMIKGLATGLRRETEERGVRSGERMAGRLGSPDQSQADEHTAS